LGCICCPLQSIKKQQADFLANPRMVRLYIKNGLVWWNKERKKDIQSKKNLVQSTIYSTIMYFVIVMPSI
jgi:hypothetical protein